MKSAHVELVDQISKDDCAVAGPSRQLSNR
jgi:YD repeat-containing protein